MEHEILGGEVWMDERGEAVVVLPDHLHGRELEYECRLQCADSTRACAELVDGRLTISCSVPHLKVGWRVIGAAALSAGSAARDSTSRRAGGGAK